MRVRQLTSHPRGDGQTLELLESSGESAVASEPTLVGQLLGCKRALCHHVLTVKALKVDDAQTVDVGVVCDALLGEILAEVGAVGAHRLTQLCQREVVLQIELRNLAVLL